MPEQNQNTSDQSPTSELSFELIQKVTDKVLAMLKEDIKLANERKRFTSKRNTAFKGTR
jgi:hypothetical protein